VRNKDLQAYYHVYTSLLSGSTQAQIADTLHVKRSTVSRKVSRLVKEGVLREKIHSNIKIYVAGAGAKAFIKRVEGYTGGNEVLVELPPGRISNSVPPLEFYRGGSPKVHNLQFSVDLSRPVSRKGTSWVLPSLPSVIDWDSGKVWDTRGKTYHCSGYVKVPGWDKRAWVHYIHSKRDKETLQIDLPVTFILGDWLDDGEAVTDYFVRVVSSIADHFRKTGYVIGEPVTKKRGIEYGFYVPLLDGLPGLETVKITDTLHVDFSGPGKKAELETNCKEEAVRIHEGIRILPELPKMKQQIQENTEFIRGMGGPGGYVPAPGDGGGYA